MPKLTAKQKKHAERKKRFDAERKEIAKLDKRIAEYERRGELSK